MSVGDGLVVLACLRQLPDSEAAARFRSEIDNALESFSRLVDNMAHMAKHN
jgi:hypothetical protein